MEKLLFIDDEIGTENTCAWKNISVSIIVNSFFIECFYLLA